MARYTSFSAHLREVFGTRVQRVPTDAGFTCPNRDPENSARGGCIYCGERGSGSGMIRRDCSVTMQLESGKRLMAARYGAERFLAYFQAYTNTLATPEQLQSLYDEALAVPDIVGLMVGTRPDALPEPVLDLLAEYGERTYFWLEMGIQSIDDRQLTWMKRGHDQHCTVAALEKAAQRRLRVCGHFIFGLPGETRDEVKRTADFVNETGMAGVKIHLLHVVRGTELQRQYEAGIVPLLEQNEYVERVCDFLERLSPNVIIQRLTGDGGTALVAPEWGRRKTDVLTAIDRELFRRGSCQGMYWDSQESR